MKLLEVVDFIQNLKIRKESLADKELEQWFQSLQTLPLWSPAPHCSYSELEEEKMLRSDT